MSEPLVSIIIPTYNSEKTLPLCLRSIKRQSYKKTEVIIVDNFSVDGTVDIAKSYGAKIIRERAERSKAKNIGLRIAKGQYVLFIDSDMELTSKVVEECVTLIESKPKVGGIIIPERSIGNSYWVKVRDFERNFYTGTPIESPRFFRRDIALEVGGFDEDLIFYEEATLPYKIEKQGYNVKARVNSCILHHEENLTLRKLLRKRYHYAKSAYIYLKRYESYKYVQKQISPIHRLKIFMLNGKFWANPILALGVLIMKFLEYIVSTLGYIVNHPVIRMLRK